MLVFESAKELQKFLREKRCEGKSIGLVPTMGALHKGHAKLIECSVKNNDLTVVSIFVNPTQFGPNEDFDKYPRTIEEDKKLLRELNADILFLPDVNTMYPNGKEFLKMSIPSLSKYWCGASRPTHFNGVVLVVSKLFNIVRPNNAYFGQKDFQQYVIIKKLAEELFFDINIIMVPIQREESGLALSSRNKYLTDEEKKYAPLLYKALKAIKENFQKEKNVERLISIGKKILENSPFKLDYLGIADSETLEPITGEIKPNQKPVVLIAAYLGTTRLIDNILLYEPKAMEICL